MLKPVPGRYADSALDPSRSGVSVSVTGGCGTLILIPTTPSSSYECLRVAMHIETELYVVLNVGVVRRPKSVSGIGVW